MFRLKLDARQCISCGICMDVCPPRAMGMRPHRGKTVEGPSRVLWYVGLQGEREPLPMMTFPFLAVAAACDGCGLCMLECPVGALALLGRAEPTMAATTGG